MSVRWLLIASVVLVALGAFLGGGKCVRLSERFLCGGKRVRLCLWPPRVIHRRGAGVPHGAGGRYRCNLEKLPQIGQKID